MKNLSFILCPARLPVPLLPIGFSFILDFNASECHARWHYRELLPITFRLSPDYSTPPPGYKAKPRLEWESLTEKQKTALSYELIQKLAAMTKYDEVDTELLRHGFKRFEAHVQDVEDSNLRWFGWEIDMNDDKMAELMVYLYIDKSSNELVYLYCLTVFDEMKNRIYFDALADGWTFTLLDKTDKYRSQNKIYTNRSKYKGDFLFGDEKAALHWTIGRFFDFPKRTK